MQLLCLDVMTILFHTGSGDVRQKFFMYSNYIKQEEKQKRLGPGGLDPVEVFETLPKVIVFIIFSTLFKRNLILFSP